MTPANRPSSLHAQFPLADVPPSPTKRMHNSGTHWSALHRRGNTDETRRVDALPSQTLGRQSTGMASTEQNRELEQMQRTQCGGWGSRTGAIYSGSGRGEDILPDKSLFPVLVKQAMNRDLKI